MADLVIVGLLVVFNARLAVTGECAMIVLKPGLGPRLAFGLAAMTALCVFLVILADRRKRARRG